MAGLFSQFVGNDGNGDDDPYTSYETYRPEFLPEPGPSLDGHRVLTDDEHIAFHQLTREVFDERGVYDMTFGYNLAKLNLDTRHPDAGFRYALNSENDSILHAEFTPTTPFCPQSDTLSIGAFRAWNGLTERHEYDIVQVSLANTHHRSENINAELRALADEFSTTGSVPDTDSCNLDAMRKPGEDFPAQDHQTDTPF